MATSRHNCTHTVPFSVVIGNADMHLKNWSLLYPDRRKPVLSPGYDFVATLPYIPNDKLALSFGGSRSLSEITSGQHAVEDRRRDGGARRRRVEGPRTGGPSAKGSARLNRQADSRGRSHSKMTLHRARLDGLDSRPIRQLFSRAHIKSIQSEMRCAGCVPNDLMRLCLGLCRASLVRFAPVSALSV
jgi:hypothetical protein